MLYLLLQQWEGWGGPADVLWTLNVHYGKGRYFKDIQF